MRHRPIDIVPVLLGLALCCTAGVLFASEPPDAEVNPITGSIESVESLDVGGGTDIRHVLDRGPGAPRIESRLTNDAALDHSPRIAIRSDGLSGVTWWREGSTGVVYLKKRSPTSGIWTEQTPISASGEDARDPEIVADGTALWIVYEIDLAGGGTDISVRGVLDDPEPIPTLIATVTAGGDRDSLIHFEADIPERT